MNLIAELEREKSFANGQTKAAAFWKARAESAERRLHQVAAVLVHAAGGKIEVGLETIGLAPELELILEECVPNFSTVYRTRRLPKKEQSA